MFESLIKKLESLEPLVSMTGKSEIDAMAKFLYERITQFTDPASDIFDIVTRYILLITMPQKHQRTQEL